MHYFCKRPNASKTTINTYSLSDIPSSLTQLQIIIYYFTFYNNILLIRN